MHNFVRGFAGLFTALSLFSLGSCATRTAGEVGILHEHDEPVIIESGSVLADFNRVNNSKVKGFLFANGLYFHRSNAPYVKRIRVWLKERDGAYKEQQCRNSLGVTVDCSGDQLGRDSFELVLNSGKLVEFDWCYEGRGGLLMSSPDLPFRVNRDRPNPFEQNVIADGATVDKVKFKFWGIDQEFARLADGKILVKLCTKLTADYCSDTPAQ